MDIKLIEVTGHYFGEGDRTQLFGVMPNGYQGDTADLPYDSRVAYWLEADEAVVVGNEYGDFTVTGVNA